jgi:hypothetical protein
MAESNSDLLFQGIVLVKIHEATENLQRVVRKAAGVELGNDDGWELRVACKASRDQESSQDGDRSVPVERSVTHCEVLRAHPTRCRRLK